MSRGAQRAVGWLLSAWRSSAAAPQLALAPALQGVRCMARAAAEEAPKSIRIGLPPSWQPPPNNPVSLHPVNNPTPAEAVSTIQRVRRPRHSPPCAQQATTPGASCCMSCMYCMDPRLCPFLLLQMQAQTPLEVYNAYRRRSGRLPPAVACAKFVRLSQLLEQHDSAGQLASSASHVEPGPGTTASGAATSISQAEATPSAQQPAGSPSSSIPASTDVQRWRQLSARRAVQLAALPGALAIVEEVRITTCL
jgi:hypothetical protein